MRETIGIAAAPRALIDGHQSQLDYLEHAFFQGRGGFGRFGAEKPAPVLDSVVWASRGGGKTFLGAVATALDLIFKPGIEIRILGGSLDQSRRMHAHLRLLFEKDALADLVDGRIGDTRLKLTNGSVVELLAQSHTAVRGTRVQTLRCDEAELFKPDVFDAAMLATRSKVIDIPGVGPTEIAGSIECLSTMHVPFGLMSRVVQSPGKKLFKWGVVDVLEACGPERACAGCVLWEECGGRAKGNVGGGVSDGGFREEHGAGKSQREKAQRSTTMEQKQATRGARRPLGKTRARSGAALSPASSGHFSISDAIRMKGRVSLPVWRTEMLCLEPSRSDTVFPEFDRARHVFDTWEGEEWFKAMESPLDAFDPLRTIMIESAFARAERHATFVCGIDFGFRAPTVILWAAIDSSGTLRILDERHVTRQTTKQHAEAILRGNGRYWRSPDWVGADPAGRQRQSQTGVSDVDVLRGEGLAVRTRGSLIQEGLGLIRERLTSATGGVSLLMHVRCTKLIEAFVQYHYKVDDPEDANPVKDGNDHAMDALRYLVLNLNRNADVAIRRYA